MFYFYLPIEEHCHRLNPRFPIEIHGRQDRLLKQHDRIEKLLLEE